jgi:PAS domain S-box-containing protein
MTSRQRRVQTLYEISLGIETGETLVETADRALSAYLQKLNCSVGGVFETTGATDQAEPTLVTSIPSNPARNELFHGARNHLVDIVDDLGHNASGRPSRTDESTPGSSAATLANGVADALPVSGTVEGAGTYYVFDLPGFGVLVLGKQGGALDVETVSALKPLNDRLGQACQANRRERSLREQRDRFEAIFAATANPTIEVAIEADGTERLNRANDAFQSVFGYSDESIQGRPLNELITFDGQPVETDVLTETIEAGDPFRREVRCETPDGIRYFLFTAVPVSAAHRTEYFGVYADITDQRERELTLQELYAAAQDILTEVSREQICQTTVQTVESVLEHPNVGVHLYDRDSGALEPVVTTDAAQKRLNIEAIRYADRDSVVWDAYRRGEPIRIDDTNVFDGRLPNEETPAGSAVVVPVGNHGVVVTAALEPHSFDDEDVYFLRVLSQLAAIGLDRKRNETGLKKTQEGARRALQTHSHEAMAESVLAELPRALNMPLMGIWKYQPARQELEPVAVTERSERVLGDAPSFGDGDSLAWRSFKDRSTLVTSNVGLHPDAYNPETPIEEEVIVPIGDFGVLIAASTHTESFSDSDAEILEFLATNLEVIAEVINSHQDVYLLNQVIARTLRHNIRNKLTAIMGYTSQIESTTDEPIRGYARRALESCRKVEKTSRHAREMRTIVNRRGDVAPVDLNSAARSAIKKVRAEFPDGEIDVDIDNAPTVTAHRKLESALAHLIRNGFEHNDSNAPQVEVSVRQNDQNTCIHISDNGPGIDPYELAVISEHTESSLEHGSGAGLWIVDRVVQYSEAALTFDTDSGTTATIAFRDR